MYRLLKAHEHCFVCIDFASGSNVLRLSGYLESVYTDCLTLIQYDESGKAYCKFSAPLSVVIAMYTDHLDEQRLQLQVALASSIALEEVEARGC